ncbi:MAG: hypothetical protein VB108_10650 [Anaerolineaceae bacterium]|nr:hypothetical protein [Anaerolineaceae bacterium]
MIRPILACINPYQTAKRLENAGWTIDFSQPPESGDPLVGISLCDNSLLLGITEGYLSDQELPYIGCGVELYLTVPEQQLQQIYENHTCLNPTALSVWPWGDTAFKVSVDGFKMMIAGSAGKTSNASDGLPQG